MSIEVALSKLRSAQICHPNAVQFLIDEAITAIQQAEVTDELLHPEDFNVEVVMKPVVGFAPVSTQGVRVTHKPTGISVTCDAARSQHTNRHHAFEQLRAILAQQPATGEPVNLQHMAVAENGALRWMTGRKVQNCELYAMPDFGRAPTLYTTPQPAQATQAEVTDADIEQVLALAHSYADAKLMRYGALGIKEPPDPSAAFIELRRAILALRPERVPMTGAQCTAAWFGSPVDASWAAEDAYNQGIQDAEAHHGITAQATKKETP